MVRGKTVLLAGLLLVMATSIAFGQHNDAVVRDYFRTVIQEPLEALGLDPFYRKYVDAWGIPVIASEKVPDGALLVARDVILYMVAERPDLRRQLAVSGARLGVMAETEMTLDIPEQRDWKKPTRDDPRLTDWEREHYDEVIARLTDAEYWNARARGMGGLYTTCAEENIMGYPGTRYFGENILVHEWSHNIHGAIEEADPELARDIETAYRKAIEAGLWKGHYAANTVYEYWAEGTQYWFESNYEHVDGDKRVLSADDLKAYDPALYELCARVYPNTHHIPMDVYHGHPARLRGQPVSWRERMEKAARKNE